MRILTTALPKRTALLAWALVSILAVAACDGGGPAPTQTSEPASPTRMAVEAPTDTPTPPPTPTSTQTPPATSSPTSTPRPTFTPTLPPTSTQTPTATFSPTSTQAPTLAPTETPATAPSPTATATAETSQPDPSVPSASELIEGAAERFSAVRSIKFEVQVEGGTIDLGAGLLVDNLTGVVAHPDRAHLKTLANTAQGAVELELIKIGSDLYLMNPFSQQWQALPPGTSKLESLDQFAVAEVFRAAGDLTYIGLDQIGGMDAWQLGATLTPEALIPLLGTLLGEEPIESEIWIGVEDQLPRKIVLTIPSDTGEALTVQISLLEFDQPVTIDPPDSG